LISWSLRKDRGDLVQEGVCSEAKAPDDPWIKSAGIMRAGDADPGSLLRRRRRDSALPKIL
jgi:hypothetical protein